MCGIVAVLNSPENPQTLLKKVTQLSKRLRHRGPDWNGVCVQKLPVRRNIKFYLRIIFF